MLSIIRLQLKGLLIQYTRVTVMSLLQVDHCLKVDRTVRPEYTWSLYASSVVRGIGSGLRRFLR